MNARLAFGGLLLLGTADLGLINFKLGPDLAKQEAELAMATKPSSSAGLSRAVVPPSVTSTPARAIQTAAPNPTPSAASEPPIASAASTAPIATAEPLVVAEPIVTAPPPATVEPPATAAPTATVAPPAVPTPVAEKPPITSGETPGPVEDIIFDLDSNRLNAANKAILEDVIRHLKATPSLRVHVRGHSDRMGSREHNLELSKKRAASVENFLHANGITGSRITTEAMGGRKPVDPNNTPAGWARNRRVEIEWR